MEATASPQDTSRPSFLRYHQQRLRAFLFQAPWYLLAVLVVHRLYRRCYWNDLHLPEEAYLQPVILWQALQVPFNALLILGPTLLGLLFWKKLRWSALDEHGRIRWLSLLLAIVLAYAFAACDYNLYFNQSHLVDRLLLLVLAGLVVVHPAAIPLFVGAAVIVVRQYEHPFGHYTWTDKKLLFDALILVTAWTGANLIKRIDGCKCLLMLLCLFASNYVYSGIAKMQINWLAENDIRYLSLGAYLNGWLGQIDANSFVQALDSLAWLNLPLMLFALVVELGMLLIFFHRWLALAMICGVMLLHAGIFAASGIFFWKWIVMGAALVVLIRTLPLAWRSELFQRQEIAWFGVVVILLSPAFFRPEELAWYDTPLSDTFELEAVGESGRVYPIARNFMSPYDLFFTQNRLGYLTEEPHLVGTYATTGKLKILEGLRTASSAEEVLSLVDSQGQDDFNTVKAARFDRFIATYFGNLNRRMDKRAFPGALPVPQHILVAAPSGAYDFQEPIHQVRVRFQRQLYVAGKVEELDRRIVHLVDIPGSRPLDPRYAWELREAGETLRR